MNHDSNDVFRELDEWYKTFRAEIKKEREEWGIAPDIEAMKQIQAATREVIRLKKRLRDAYDALGCAYQQKGDENDAQYYFDKARKLWRRRRRTKSEMDQYAELFLERVAPEWFCLYSKALDQISRLNPKLADAYDALGHAYQQKGDEDNAQYYFDKAEIIGHKSSKKVIT